MLTRRISKSARLGFRGMIKIVVFSVILLPVARAQKQQHTEAPSTGKVVTSPNAEAKSNPKTAIADRFKVSFVSTAYDTSISVADSSKDQHRQPTEHLRVRCEVGILEPDMVLGVSRWGTITQLENGKGETIDVVDQRPSRSKSFFYRYEAPAHRMRSMVIRKPTDQKTPTQSAPRLTSVKSPGPQYELKPVRMTFDLDPQLLGPDSKKINHVKGHFYVLMAESLEHVEIPFEPNEQWVRLPPDLEIQVLEAQSTKSSYSYRIETRRGKRMFEPFSPESDLPSRFVVSQQLLGPDGKTTPRYAPPNLPPWIGGNGSGSGGNVGPIEKIRFVIAVNPSHHKIPFELEDIPLPVPRQKK